MKENTERCNKNCLNLLIRSGNDYDVLMEWSNAYCMAGKKFVFESNGDKLKSGNFAMSESEIAKILEIINCIAPDQKQKKEEK